jgi:hypothetical protein
VFGSKYFPIVSNVLSKDSMRYRIIKKNIGYVLLNNGLSCGMLVVYQAEDRATQGCDLSADLGPEYGTMRG